MPDKSSSTLDDHILIGWNTERDGSGQEYPAGSEYVPVLGRNVILYARWLPIQEAGALRYVIDGDDNLDRQGIYEDPSENENEGYFVVGAAAPLTNAIPTRDAHEFLGWSKVPVSDIDYFDDVGAQSFMESSNYITSVRVNKGSTNVYAVWQEKYPDRIINGDFEYPGKDHPYYYELAEGEAPWNRGIVVCPDGTYYQYLKHGADTSTISSWSYKRFGWRSETKAYLNRYINDVIPAGSVGLDYDGKSSNCLANLQCGNANTGNTAGTSLHQDIITEPGTLYKWSLDHASNDQRLVNDMSVMIGTVELQEAQDAYRITANEYGQDKIGPVQKEFYTAVNKNRKNVERWWEDEWERYEGVYLVPENQYVTRFTFKNLNTIDNELGSRIDNVVFSKSHPLTYDMNDDDSEIKAQRNGIYEQPSVTDQAITGYIQEGIHSQLTDIEPTREGYRFLGWSIDKKLPAQQYGVDLSQIEEELVTSINPVGAATAYAVWQENSAPLTYVIEGYDKLSREGIYEVPDAVSREGYHDIGSVVTAIDIVPKRQVHTFLGWSDVPVDDIDYLADDKAQEFLDNEHHITSFMMPEGGKTLYAVWQQAYPDRIINGGFEYPEVTRYAPITPSMDPAIEFGTNIVLDISNWRYTSGAGWRTTVLGPIPNMNKKLFAWDTDYYDSRLLKGNAVCLSQGIEKGQANTMVGLVSGSVIRQDIITQPNTLYRWKLKHSTAYTDNTSTAQVKIGSPEPSNAASFLPQDATLTSSNGASMSVVGQRGKSFSSSIAHISSVTAASPILNNQERVTTNDSYTVWNTLEGSYFVPENQWLTRFEFSCLLNSSTGDSANVFDDISFALAHPLYYDLRGGSSDKIYSDPNSVYSQNDYLGYVEEGEDHELLDVVPYRKGYRFLGWAKEPVDDVAMNDQSALEQAESKIVHKLTMPEEEATVYAVWQDNAAPLEYVIEGYDHVDRNGIYEEPEADGMIGFHNIGEEVTLTEVTPLREAHEFIGWAKEPVDDIGYWDDEVAEDFLTSDNHVTSIVIPEEGMIVYAVWKEKYAHEIINGTFEYPEMKYFTPGWEHRWVGISIVSGRWEQNRGNTGLLADTVPNFDPRLYAWRSTFNFEFPVSDQPGITEIQREIDTDNQYADLAYGERNSDVYQDIITVPGAVYKWKIKQCSNRTDFNDILNVEIGSSSAQSPQDGWRTTQNAAKLGALGPVGKDMSTTVIVGGNFNHKDQWEQYEGSYTVPEGQWVTRFLFKMANNNGSAVGCLVDDIEFSISYALTYDLNNGTSETIYEDPKTENYQGYHCEGDEVKLFGNSDVKAPTGLTFLGWSRDEASIITNSMSKEEIAAICDDIVDNTFVMPAENVTLHAVYMETPEVQIGKNGEGMVEGPSIVVPDGSRIPRYEYDITPDSGSAIAEIIVDGKPLDGFPKDEGESYRLVLDDVIGKHEVQVTFQYQLIEVPETGGAGTIAMVMLTIVAAALVVGATMVAGACARKRKSKERGAAR